MRFARETDDDIGGDGQIRTSLAHGFAETQVFLVLVRTAHELQNAVTAALHGEMDVAAQLGQVGVGIYQVLAETDGVRAGEADALQSVHVVQFFQQAYKGAAAVDNRLILTVAVHNLPQQGDFLHAAVHKFSYFLQNIGLRAAAFGTTGAGDNAVGAAHFTPLHDGDEGGAVAGWWQVVADFILEPFLLLRGADVCPSADRFEIRLSETAAQQSVTKLVHVVVLLGTGYNVQTWHIAEKGGSTALAHAAHEAVNHPGLGGGASAEETHFAQCFQLGLFADGAGVDEDDIGLCLILGELITAGQEHAGYLFGVALIHLAAVSFNQYTGHADMLT